MVEQYTVNDDREWRLVGKLLLLCVKMILLKMVECKIKNIFVMNRTESVIEVALTLICSPGVFAVE